MASKYELWTLPLIRQELKRRGAKSNGRKAECVERLEHYDRNKDFRMHELDTEGRSDFTMELPPLQLYKDVNTTAELPNFTEPAANQYLFPFDKALGKQNRLWKARFMRYLRWAKQNNHLYLRGNCKAEMKKSVTYNVDIKLDECANVRQAQCECAAGMGPNAHCKHIVCLLFCIVHFFKSGKLNTELSCTEKLQTFHKAKPYSGSPVKMSNLSFGKSSKNPSSENLRFDPRPPKFRNREGYNYFVQNLAVNVSLQCPNMPILQIVKPANPYALVHDHAYLPVSMPDYLLQHLKVTKITETECNDLESSTRGQSNNSTWKHERLHRLHSSNFGRICKATDRTDMDALAKTLTCKTKLNVAAVRYGRTFEGVAVDEYERLQGNKVHQCGIYVRPEYPYVASSPDGIVSNTVSVEVKCPYIARDKPINPTTVPYLGFKSDGTLDLCTTHDYYYQIQGQLYCSNRETCHLVVYTKKEIQVIPLVRDEEFISRMLAKLTEFFECHFKPALLNKYIYRDYYQYNFDT